MFATSDFICVLAKKCVQLKPKSVVRLAIAVELCSFMLVLNSVQLLAVAGACYL